MTQDAEPDRGPTVEESFVRMNFAVRSFLLHLDLMSSLSTAPQLYLEFPDIGAMHRAHALIVREIGREFTFFDPGLVPWHQVDDHTIAFRAFAGVTIILSCKQRFALPIGGLVDHLQKA